VAGGTSPLAVYIYPGVGESASPLEGLAFIFALLQIASGHDRSISVHVHFHVVGLEYIGPVGGIAH
jgi:hypothetical protein